MAWKPSEKMDTCNLGKKVSTTKIALVGHVDHGKSSILGRLLADTNSLPKGKLDRVKKECLNNSKPFEYAFLLDALKEEQSQGITIDTARCFFKIKNKNFIFLDAPGHIEFIKNMITGAASTDAAIIVIDANEGIKENSYRHGFLLSFLNVKQVLVLVNKMDLVAYSEARFNELVNSFDNFLNEQNISPIAYIPVSARNGDNIATYSNSTPWYKKNNLFDYLQILKEQKKIFSPFRFPIQDVYKFTSKQDDRRILAGTILSGTINKGDQIIFYPSLKKTKIKSIEHFSEKNKITAKENEAIGFTLEDPLFVQRGDLAIKENEKKPILSKYIKVKFFWLGAKPIKKNKKYFLRILTSKISFEIQEILSVFNTSTFKKINKDQIDQNESAECILSLEKPIAFDLANDSILTSRFVIIDEYYLSGGGMIIDSFISDAQKEALFLNQTQIPIALREKKHKTKTSIILFSGIINKDHLFDLEKQLFEQNISTYLYLIDEKMFEKNHSILSLIEAQLQLGISILIHFEGLSKKNYDLLKKHFKRIYFLSINIGSKKIFFTKNFSSFNLNNIKKLILPNIKC